MGTYKDGKHIVIDGPWCNRFGVAYQYRYIGEIPGETRLVSNILVDGFLSRDDAHRWKDNHKRLIAIGAVDVECDLHFRVTRRRGGEE